MTSWKSLANLPKASGDEPSTSTGVFHRTAQEIISPDADPQAVADGPPIPRRGHGEPNRARGQMGWRKNRNRGRYQPYGSQYARKDDVGSNQGTTTTNETTGQLAPLSAAKSVIKDKLSVMFRGLRGIEAAQAAFDMCGVEIGFQVHDRASASPSEGAGRGRGGNSRGRYRKPRRGSYTAHSNPDPRGDAQD